MNHIKINLPETEQDYINGNGEGVFLIVSDEVKAAYDNDEAGTSYSGILDNYSIYYKGLKPGHIIPFEMRGEQRPVANYEWLKDHKKPKRETYTQMNYRHQKYFNALPIKFAFSKDQYKRILDAWSIREDEAAAGAIINIGNGGFIRAQDKAIFLKAIEWIREEDENAIKEDQTGEGYIYQMFLYELQNHEFNYTRDTADTLNALGITEEDIKQNDNLRRGLCKAVAEITSAGDPLDF